MLRGDADSAAIAACRSGPLEHKTDSFTLQQSLHQLLNIRILLRQHALADNRDLGAQTLLGLRYLHANGTAPDDRHRRRERVDIEDVLISDKGCVLET